MVSAILSCLGVLLFVVLVAMVGPSVRDAALKVTKALPNGAATIYTDGIDLMHAAAGQDFGARCELLITAPGITLAILANTQTMIYTVQHDDDAAFGTVQDLYGIVATQTGATGTDPCAAVSKRVRLPHDVKRYVRVKAVKSGAGDASGSNVVAELLF